MEFRNASLGERKEFYENEFDPNKIAEAMAFTPQLLAVDTGSKTGITRFPGKAGGLIFLPPNLTPKQVKEKFIHYLPEGAYYDRNTYLNAEEFFARKNFKKFWEDENYSGQQLCFDVDADNIEKVDHNHKENYTAIIKKAAQQALKLAEVLRNQHSFQKISFVYSGRGFHVKVNDKGSEKLSFRQRRELNDSLRGFPIDRWVSGGYSKLMRLPFSLHGVVSRVTTPVKEEELSDFDPANEKVIPKFLMKPQLL